MTRFGLSEGANGQTFNLSTPGRRWFRRHQPVQRFAQLRDFDRRVERDAMVGGLCPPCPFAVLWPQQENGRHIARRARLRQTD